VTGFYIEPSGTFPDNSFDPSVAKIPAGVANTEDYRNLTIKDQGVEFGTDFDLEAEAIEFLDIDTCGLITLRVRYDWSQYFFGPSDYELQSPAFQKYVGVSLVYSDFPNPTISGASSLAQGTFKLYIPAFDDPGNLSGDLLLEVQLVSGGCTGVAAACAHCRNIQGTRTACVLTQYMRVIITTCIIM
jgi:hypothetical protein